MEQERDLLSALRLRLGGASGGQLADVESGTIPEARVRQGESQRRQRTRHT